MGVCAGLAPPPAGSDKPVPHHIIPRDGRKLRATSSLSSQRRRVTRRCRHLKSHDCRGVLDVPHARGMTARVKLIPSRGADRVRAIPSTHPPSIGGRREDRALASPMARLLDKKCRRQEPQVWPKQPGLPCAMALRLIRALLGDRRSCPRHRHRRQLGISTGMPGPHDFAVLSALFVRSRTARCNTDRPSHPAPRVVTIAKRPSYRNGTTLQYTFSEKEKVKYFCQ